MLHFITFLVDRRNLFYNTDIDDALSVYKVTDVLLFLFFLFLSHLLSHAVLLPHLKSPSILICWNSRIQGQPMLDHAMHILTFLFGGPRKISKFPGDLQRRKRDSEKISRNENKKRLLYDDVGPSSGS